jgi:hypothetical protein
MKNTTHTCKAHGCKDQIPKRYLMCRFHWGQVPQPLRAAVWAAWANVQTSGQFTDAYAIAVRNAINSIKSTPRSPLVAQAVDQF